MQTSTGIKDAFTQHWIEELLDRARDLKKRYPQRTAANIQVELMNWVDENKDNVYNSFLTLEGIRGYLLSPHIKFYSPHHRLQCCSRYSHGNSSHNPPQSGLVSLAWNSHILVPSSKRGILETITGNKHNGPFYPRHPFQLYHPICKFLNWSPTEDPGSGEHFPHL